MVVWVVLSGYVAMYSMQGELCRISFSIVINRAHNGCASHRDTCRLLLLVLFMYCVVSSLSLYDYLQLFLHVLNPQVLMLLDS